MEIGGDGRYAEWRDRLFEAVVVPHGYDVADVVRDPCLIAGNLALGCHDMATHVRRRGRAIVRKGLRPISVVPARYRTCTAGPQAESGCRDRSDPGPRRTLVPRRRDHTTGRSCLGPQCHFNANGVESQRTQSDRRAGAEDRKRSTIRGLPSAVHSVCQFTDTHLQIKGRL